MQDEAPGKLLAERFEAPSLPQLPAGKDNSTGFLHSRNCVLSGNSKGGSAGARITDLWNLSCWQRPSQALSPSTQKRRCHLPLTDAPVTRTEGPATRGLLHLLPAKANPSVHHGSTAGKETSSQACSHQHCWHLLHAGICSTLASALWQVGLGDDPALGCHALSGHCPTCSGTPLTPSLKPWLHLLSQHHPGGLWQRIAALSHPQPLLVLHQPTGLAWTIQKHIVPYQVLQELLYFQLLSSCLKPEAFLMLLLCLQELLSCVFLFLPPESSLFFQLTLQALHFSCKHDQQQESEPLLT